MSEEDEVNRVAGIGAGASGNTVSGDDQGSTTILRIRLQNNLLNNLVPLLLENEGSSQFRNEVLHKYGGDRKGPVGDRIRPTDGERRAANDDIGNVASRH